MQGHFCQYRIADQAEEDGTYAAVCDDNHCQTKFYTLEELVRYTINPQKMALAIARCLGVHPQFCKVTTKCWQVGELPGSQTTVPILFTRVKFDDAMLQVIESLILKGQQRFILVTPTARYFNRASRDLLMQANSRALALDEITDIDGHQPVLTEAGRIRWQKLKEAVGGAAVLGTTFPTPPGAAWHDLTIVFRDGHTVVASIGSIREAYTFQNMGMVNQNSLSPDEQWQLLYHFAEEMGVFTWKNKHADHRNKKRKERLAARLKAFFGIPGNPFAYRKDNGGWEAVFNVRIG